MKHKIFKSNPGLFLIIFIGLISLWLHHFIHTNWIKTIEAYEYHFTNLQNSKDFLTIFHLWFEEYIEGDKSISIYKIEKLLLNSKKIIKDMVEIESYKEPINIKFFKGLKNIEKQISIFSNIEKKRLTMKKKGGVGTSIDQKFDDVFKSIIKDFSELNKLTKIHLNFLKNKQHNRYLINIFLLLILILIVIKINLLFEKKRINTEKHIKSLNRDLMIKNKEMEQIIYVSSHDLRSPMVNIHGFSQLINSSLEELKTIIDQEVINETVKKRLKPIIDENLPEAIGFILNSTLKVGGLLDGLLKISRLSRTVLKIGNIDMNMLLLNVIQNHQSEIKNKEITIEVEKLPPCKGDKLQIDQVFSNIIDNAIKYSNKEKKGFIRICGEHKEDELIYSIEDNGQGIPESCLEKIFTIFYQVSPKKYSGEGLGLAIVNKILVQHGGKIWVESALGKGSKFFISLPITGYTIREESQND